MKAEQDSRQRLVTSSRFFQCLEGVGFDFSKAWEKAAAGFPNLGKVAAVVVFGLFVSGCATQLVLPPPPVANAPSRGLSAEQLKSLQTELGDYKLGAGDEIQIFAMDIAELNRKYVIGPDGKITVPGFGVVLLDGLTREQAAKTITDLVKKQYLSPRIDVIVEAYNNNRIFVLGEVRKPGQYNFPGRPLLLSALARAEGLTDKADMHGCTIVRGKGMLLEIDIYDLLRKGDQTVNIPLLPEDAVYVKASEEHTFFVLGEVKNPGVYPRGESVDVVRAISMAGGYTEDGALQKVHIIRRTQPDKPEQIDVDMEALMKGRLASGPMLESGDIVFVERRGWAKFNYYLRQLTPTLNTIMVGASLKTLSQ
jgi:polysaccharide export outer membrane protein